MRCWKFIQAPPETDIIWQGIHKDSIWSDLKTFVLYILLIAFSIFLLTPLMLIHMSSAVIEDMNLNVKWLDKTTLTNYISSAMIMFMNVILIPFFIDIMVTLEDHPTKSSRQITILNRNFFFMLLNSLLLPLTGLNTIKAFWQALED